MSNLKKKQKNTTIDDIKKFIYKFCEQILSIVFHFFNYKCMLSKILIEFFFKSYVLLYSIYS